MSDSLDWLLQGLWHRRDPRVRDRFLQSSPWTILACMAGYLTLVMVGPRLMRRRSTPPLKLVMQTYNLLQVWLSAYMVREFVASRPAGWLCSPMEFDNSPRSRRMTNACLLFHFSKLVDFLDTVFLVLKKDFNRMSYLHVFHHASMFFSYYLGTLYMPGDPSWLGCTLNCSVHCVMYSYYFLASLGPAVRRYLWWKRYLTQLQLAQFAFVLCNLFIAQVPGYRCHLPAWALPMTFVYTTIIICLFVNFYRHAYTSAKIAASAPGVGPQKEVPNGTPAGQTPGKLPLAWRIIKTHGPGCFLPLPNQDKHKIS